MRVNVVGPIALALFGAIFLAAGWASARSGADEARELADHPPRVVSIADLEDAPIGSEVFVSATVSRANPRGFGEFVAYDQDEYLGLEPDPPGAREGRAAGARARPERERERWRVIAHRRPALELVDGATSVRFAHGDYALAGALHRVGDGARRRPEWGRPGSVRTVGVAIGDVVVVRGSVVGSSGGAGAPRALRASSVFVGDRRAFLDSLAESASALRIVGIVFRCVGAAVVAAAAGWFFIARRIARRRRTIR